MSGTAHLVVRASAGAGKTFTLSNRYLKLLHQGAAPQTILATTFTRMAAGEILQRVLTRLADAATDADGAARLGRELRLPQFSLADARRMLVELVGMLHCVGISTIDSFFNRMAQCFRHELGLPADAAVLAQGDPIAVQLRRQAIDAMLADDEPGVLIDLLRRLHHDQAQRSVTTAIDAVVRQLHEVYRQTGQNAWSVLEPPAGVLDRVALAEALERLQDAPQHLPDDKRMIKAWQSNLIAAMGHNWPAFVQSGLAAKIAAGEPKFYNKLIPDPVVEAYQPLIDHARGELISRVAHRTAAMFELLNRFDRHYTRLRHDRGVLLFADVTHKLAHDLPAMGDDLLMHVYYRLDAKVQHLLLDEFQDTSVEQWQVLKPFAQEIRAHGNGDQADRTFFCVGDVKQAIYGWRGGCDQIFGQVEMDMQLPAHAAQTLSTSFRSSPIVLDAVNRVFASIADSAPLADHRDTVLNWQQDFQPHTANQGDKPGYFELISSSAAIDEDDGDPVGPTPHQYFVADKIAELAHQAAGASIGVLVRTNQAVKQLIYLLKRLGLDASGEGGTPVTDDPAVNAVISAMKLADHPGDTAAAFHLLNSPLRPIVQLESIHLRHTAPTARRIRRAIAAEGYAATIARWTKKLAPSCTPRSIVRLSQLIDLADRYAPHATLRTGDFVRYVSDTAVEEPSQAAIRVMTIHKAKGLEFDIVVLGELERPMGRTSGLPVWIYRQSPTAPPAAVFATSSQYERRLIESHCPTYGQAHQQETARRLSDDLSALYVAMTRPRYALHLIVQPPGLTAKGKLSSRGLTDMSDAAVLRDAFDVADESPAGGQTLHSAGDAGWHRALQKPPTPHAEQPTMLNIKLATPADGPKRSWPTLRPSAAADRAVVRADDLLNVEPQANQLRGTVIHAMFEMIDWLAAPGAPGAPGGDPAPPGSDGEPDEQALLAAARRAAPQQDDHWHADMLEQFKRILQHDAVRQALAKPSGDVELWRERPFAVQLDGALVQGVFDRVVIHRRDGKPCEVSVIDFKTDRIDGDDLSANIEHYRPQMQTYRRAVHQLLGVSDEQVQTRLLFVGPGRSIDV